LRFTLQKLLGGEITAHFFGNLESRLPRSPFFFSIFVESSLIMNDADYAAGATTREVASITRRSFLGVLLGFGTVVVGAALSVPLIRFALHPLLTKTTEIGWSDVGKVDEFASLTAPLKKLIRVEQRDAWRKIISEKAIYVLPIRDGAVHVLSPICPHLGCSIPWNEAKQQFICPCHVAVFAMDGNKISGPAPRSMDDLESKVEDGVLKVRYQYFRQLIPTKEVLS
jgi:menaquinol-cytochrome c reductase iron-sulfur subunit